MIIQNKLTDGMRDIIKYANEFQIKNKVREITTELLLIGVLSANCVAKRLLAKYGVVLQKIAPKVKELCVYSREIEKKFSLNATAVLDLAQNFALESGCNFTATEHLLYAMVNSQKTFAYSLIKSTATDFEMLKQETYEVVLSLSKVEEKFEPSKGQNTQERTFSKKSTFDISTTPLEKFGVDLTAKARQGKLDPVIGRDKEIARIVQTLSRRIKSNPMLIGEPGIGKSAVIEGLAQKIVSGDVPTSLQDVAIISLDLASIVASSKYRGEFEQNFKNAIEYCKDNENIVLFIDEIHTLMGVGKGSDVQATEMLKPALSRGELRLIGATTINEYRKYIEKDPALGRRFQTIMLEPPSESDCIEIIKGIRENFETHHRVRITDEAIEAAVTLSERYITDRFLPDKAIDLIDEAAAHKRLILCTPDDELRRKESEVERLENERDYAFRLGKSVAVLDEKIKKLAKDLDELYDLELLKQSNDCESIGAEDIAKIISDITDIPIAKLTETESERLLKLEDELHKRVIGQEEAVSAVSKAIRRARACVKDASRHIGSFIFVGPTGVGKTELTKALAEAVFGDEKMLVRVDMSEYMEKASVSKLIGAPPGYVGYDEEGQLTEKVRRKPFSVVLFDEIEKAHIDVFNLMLQILDDGRLTDSKGRLVNFKNTIIIMTSNAGAQEANETKSFGFGETDSRDNAKEKMLSALKKQFKPEFLNRVDDIIVFNKLTKDECGQIADILCQNLKKRLLEQDIYLIISESAKELILEKGYDNEYGARPLRRTIQKLIEDAVSEKIIAGEISRGDKVVAQRDGDKLSFVKKY